MDYEKYKIVFEKEASNAGYSEQYIIRCLEYAKILLSVNLPVIYTISHLSVLVGYKKEYLLRVEAHSKYFYREFEILKKNGKKRKISEPLPSLKEIQNWIRLNILYKVKISQFAKAYRPKVSIIENLRFHKKQSKVFTLDLEDFFTSIKVESIEKIFRELGYSEILSKLFSKLCTKDNSLPQGAPTSPFLSNIFFKPADDLISSYCVEKKIRYTRYADDLTFSGDFNENELLNKVTEIIENLNLRINKSKTKLMTPNTRQTVTGIVVNEKPQVVFHKRNELRQTMYFIKKFGLEEQIKFKKIKQANYLEHLLGQVNFILQINKEDKEFIGYKSVLNKLKNNQSYKKE